MGFFKNIGAEALVFNYQDVLNGDKELPADQDVLIDVGNRKVLARAKSINYEDAYGSCKKCTIDVLNRMDISTHICTVLCTHSWRSDGKDVIIESVDLLNLIKGRSWDSSRISVQHYPLMK